MSSGTAIKNLPSHDCTSATGALFLFLFYLIDIYRVVAVCQALLGVECRSRKQLLS